MPCCLPSLDTLPAHSCAQKETKRSLAKTRLLLESSPQGANRRLPVIPSSRPLVTRSSHPPTPWSVTTPVPQQLLHPSPSLLSQYLYPLPSTILHPVSLSISLMKRDFPSNGRHRIISTILYRNVYGLGALLSSSPESNYSILQKLCATVPCWDGHRTMSNYVYRFQFQPKVCRFG